MLRRILSVLLSPNMGDIRVILGTLIWLLWLANRRPELASREWGETLLIFAAVWVVPLSLPWLRTVSDKWLELLWQTLHATHLPAAVLLMASFALSPGWAAVLLASPWFMVLSMLATLGLLQLVKFHTKRNIGPVCFHVGGIFTVVGGAWLVCDRLAYRPLDFDADIVLLTAIHFHYAALALPVSSGLLVEILPRWWTKLTAILILLSVPLVAAGITFTHLTRLSWLESIAATLLSVSAVIVAIGQLSLLRRQELPIANRIGLAIGALALVGAMILSALYGLRHYIQLDFLDIPFMRKWHGSTAALGFSAITLLAWRRIGVLERRLPAQ